MAQSDQNPAASRDPRADIAERERSAGLLRRYEFIVNAVDDMMTVINREYVYEAVNDAWCRSVSRPRDELVSMSVASVWGQETFERDIKPRLDRCFAGHEVSYETWIELGAKGQRCCQCTLYPYPKERDSVTHAVVVTHDITEHKRSEETLRESEDRYRTLVDLGPDIIYRLDENGEIVYISDAVRQLGHDPEALIGRRFEELVHPEDRPGIENGLVERRVGERATKDVEVRLVSACGSEARPYELSYRTVSISARGLWNVSDEQINQPDKEFICTQGIAHDITVRKEAERALAASEKRLRRQHRVLSELAEAQVLIESGLRASFPKITEAAARGLEVARASIWLYNEDRSAVRCFDLFERDSGRHSEGLEVVAADYPAYFRAIERGRTIAADDARSDPKTAELADDYLVPSGITSMLDTVIWVQGEMAGVVCHEHAGPPRQWTIEEKSFAHFVAELASLAMEANHRRRAEEDLRQRVDWAGGLQKAGEDLATCRTIEEVANVASKAPVEHLGLLLAFVRVPHGSGGVRLLGSSRPGLDDYSKDLGCGSEVLRTKQPKLVPDVEGSPPFPDCRDRARRVGFGCCATFPIIAQDRCVAALTVRCDEVGPNARLMQAVPMLEVFCGQVGHVWQRCLDEEERRKLWRAIEHSPASVVVTDLSGTIEYVNPKFSEVTGYTAEEAIGQNPRVLKTGDHPPEFYKELWDTILAGDEWHGELCNKKKNGEIYWEHASISPIQDGQGNVTHFVAVKEDITERRRAEEALRERTEELEAFNEAMVDREDRVIELKEEVNRLARELGREAPYEAVWEAEDIGTDGGQE